MSMAREFESGFFLVERCHRELPRLSRCFPPDSDMCAALAELTATARRVEALLHERAAGIRSREHASDA